MKMAQQEVSILSAVIVLSMLWAGGMAQSDDCTSVVVSMSPCFSDLSANSKGPSPECCTQLGSVATSQPECMCKVLDGGGSNLGVKIDPAQAQALPKLCNIQTTCKAPSPGASPPTEQNSGGPQQNSGGGSKTVLSSSVLYFIVFTISYVSAFSNA